MSSRHGDLRALFPLFYCSRASVKQSGHWSCRVRDSDGWLSPLVPSLCWPQAAGRAADLTAQCSSSVPSSSLRQLQTSLPSTWEGRMEAKPPLISAAMAGDLPAVKALLEGGARVNEVWDHYPGYAPLHYAAAKGHLPVVEVLLQYGADVNLKTTVSFYPPLYLAVRGGHTPVVVALANAGARLDCGDEDGCTALHWAAGDGDVTVVEALLAHGADVHATVAGGSTPLIWAAESGHLQVVQALLKAGANVNHAMEGGKTALYSAVESGFLQVAEALLTAGANVNHTDEDGWTPLCHAARAGRLSMVQALLGHGALVDGEGGKYAPIKLVCDALDSPDDDVPPAELMDVMVVLLDHGADTECLGDGACAHIVRRWVVERAPHVLRHVMVAAAQEAGVALPHHHQ